MSWVRGGVIVAVMVVLGIGSLVPPAEASRPPWGACGLGTAEDKPVASYMVNRSTYATLRCGGPRWTAEPTSGYRHILARHRDDFERMTFGTGQNWRDIADLSMEAIASDPDVVLPVSGDKMCRSRVIFVRHLRTNQVAGQRIVKMIVANGSNNIVTAYPASRQCAAGEPAG